jgi:hypothetical protein
MVNCKSGAFVQWRRPFEALKSFHCKNSRTRISRTAAAERAAGAARPTELVISSLAFCWKDISSVAPACNAPSCRFAVGAKSPASKITAEAAAIRMGDFKALSWQGFAFYYWGRVRTATCQICQHQTSPKPSPIDPHEHHGAAIKPDWGAFTHRHPIGPDLFREALSLTTPGSPPPARRRWTPSRARDATRAQCLRDAGVRCDDFKREKLTASRTSSTDFGRTNPISSNEINHPQVRAPASTAASTTAASTSNRRSPVLARAQHEPWSGLQTAACRRHQRCR